MRRLLTLGWLATLVSIANVSFAQDFNNQLFQPANGPDSIFTVEGANTVGHLQPAANLILSYSSRSLILEEADGDEIDLVDQQLVLHGLFGLGITDRLQIDLHFPFYLVNEGQTLAGEEFNEVAVGDLNFRPKFTILPNKDGGFGLGALVDVALPIGTSDRYVSSSFEVTPKILADFKVGDFKVAANLGALFTEDKELVDTDYTDSLTYGIGAEYAVLNGLITFDGELYGRTAFSDFFESDVTPLEGLLGAKLVTTQGIQVMAGGGGGLVSGVSSPAFRAFVGIGYARRSNDFDGDGILNDVDACPETPEDIDGFEDEDGCPESDNDGDGIVDEQDGCPDEPEDVDDFEDEDGCPDVDNDGDGINDDVDQCRDEPEDVNQFEDEDGCPDGSKDTDADGIPDAKDQCPQEPEDADGFQDEDGCPDKDNDNDGIVDPEDACPNEPGLLADKGCPPKEQKAVLEKDAIKILDKVFFESDKAIIKSDSYNLLDQVALILRSNPQVKMVEIGGHTDDRGKEEYNQQLSEARANAVMTYMTKKGIDGSRLKAVGYGEAQPIEAKKTRKARAKNRRVEFKILDQGK